MSDYKSLSKTKYLSGLQCRKKLWVEANDKGRLPQTDEATQAVFDQGHEVGRLAHSLFPGGLNLESDNFGENLRETKTSLRKRLPLFEAGFSVSHLYCRVDILAPSGESAWDIVEVKSSTEIRAEHLNDVAFQHHCCTLAGLTVARCRIMYLNKDYVRRGEIDPSRLFVSEDVTDRLGPYAEGIETRIADMLALLSTTECPEEPIGGRCNSPYPCVLQEECWAYLPKHHVMTLYYGKKMGEELLGKGILHIKDIPADIKLNPKQKIQKECVECGDRYIDRAEIRAFLDKLKYPLYFMDFETFMTAVPMYDGTGPYQQIPFQFSVHVADSPGAKPRHQAFLAKGAGDPRPEFLAALKAAIGPEGTVLVYYEAFEKARLRELADAFPEYKKWVAEIDPRIEDLLVPFKEFAYYHPSQLGSASLKKVMPALTGIGYDNLEIGHGEIASLRYSQMAFGDATAEEKRKIRRDLLKYCQQDTGGMVKIIEQLDSESRRLF